MDLHPTNRARRARATRALRAAALCIVALECSQLVSHAVARSDLEGTRALVARRSPAQLRAAPAGWTRALA